VDNPIFYGALMMFEHVEFPGFHIICCVSGTGNVMYRVVPAAACLLFWILWEPLL
jgi:hypothetical protein